MVLLVFTSVTMLGATRYVHGGAGEGQGPEATLPVPALLLRWPPAHSWPWGQRGCPPGTVLSLGQALVHRAGDLGLPYPRPPLCLTPRCSSQGTCLHLRLPRSLRTSAYPRLLGLPVR